MLSSFFFEKEEKIGLCVERNRHAHSIWHTDPFFILLALLCANICCFSFSGGPSKITVADVIFYAVTSKLSGLTQWPFSTTEGPNFSTLHYGFLVSAAFNHYEMVTEKLLGGTGKCEICRSCENPIRGSWSFDWASNAVMCIYRGDLRCTPLPDPHSRISSVH